MRGGDGKTKRRKSVPAIVILSFAILAYFVTGAVVRLAATVLYPVKYSDFVDYYSSKFGVPEEIVYSVILAESKFRADAVSRAGACGLMQLMPKTYEKVASELERIPNELMIFDPGMNICCGTYLLSVLYEKYGSWDTAFAAYNAGESAVDGWLADEEYSENGKLTSIPYRETENYVKKVCRAIGVYRVLYGM